MNVSEEVKNLTHDFLLVRFQNFGSISGVSLVNGATSAQEDEVIDFRSEIFIYGTDITLRLQLFFNLESYTRHIAHLFDKVTESKVIDFFNEVCNLTCGKVKEILVDHGVNAALSLPISVESPSTVKELYREVLPDIFDSWFVNANKEMLFKCRVSMAIHNASAFSGFNPVSAEEDQAASGDIEFF